MASVGISIKIDLNKIDESRIFHGKNGARYVDLTTFVDNEKESQYGDHGFISQSTSKEERDAGVQTPIVGNSKIFYFKGDGGQQQPSNPRQFQQPPMSQAQQDAMQNNPAPPP